MIRTWRRAFAYYLVTRNSRIKLAIALAVDAIVLAMSMAFAVVLARYHRALTPESLAMMMVAGPLVTIGCLWIFGAYRAVVRFIDMKFIERCLLAMISAPILLHFLYALFDRANSWRALITYAFVAFVSLMVLRRMATRFLRPFMASSDCKSVLIYGAGDAGTQLAAALDINCQHRPVAFVDDRLDLQGRTIRGLQVYSLDQVKALKQKLKFDRVLLAIPSAGRSRRRKILEHLESLAVQVLVMPGIEDLASGGKRIDDLREVQVEDILDRDAVAPIDDLLDACIRGQSVMVTGAGGSIGSELCRQIVKLGAKRLVLFETSEYALYAIGQELQGSLEKYRCEIVPVLANMLDRDAVARTLRSYGINTIYHAAAYKHVPLVESNVVTAVRNNVIGTLNVAEEAIANAVRNVVLISTDKAVRPTNVMGASKRVCELIIQALAPTSPNTRMTMVRFGNVLASSGSVVPLFKKQISAGGPVTVTHPEVTRYFMTIPEAALLVIQAGSMGARGEVFVLDMGRPVKILDLARRMIHLSGLDIREPGTDKGDIEIKFTGLRPGEKLYEELLIADRPEDTRHPRIFKAHEEGMDWSGLVLQLKQIESACQNHDIERIKLILRVLVTGYFSTSKDTQAGPECFEQGEMHVLDQALG
ncbi:MAG TPA: nucleoside-diphosphate sugar epimerase/dehydratase [Stenotrophobium sp.]|nr:nucleoside-diphosphate sugar epimerase/dehydratase [Stenotrophobium sp.]